ncbi:hypothetical protein ACFQYP_18205 [Nonomuraea antimicrobica]|uniref:hypothetical protein n=1 Tax=Nonomuraea antimicrobica TaxID=561173 RepID=UPI0031EC9FC4
MKTKFSHGRRGESAPLLPCSHRRQTQEGERRSDCHDRCRGLSSIFMHNSAIP